MTWRTSSRSISLAVVLTGCLSFCRMAGAEQLGGQCIDLFKENLTAQVAASRTDFFLASLRANMKFPQMNAGIQLSLLSHYFHHPDNLENYYRDPTDLEINEASERMNQAHSAYGVRANTEAPVSSGLHVTRQRLSALIRANGTGTVASVVATIALLFPESSVAKSINNNGNIDTPQGQRELPALATQFLNEIAHKPEQKKLNEFIDIVDETLLSRGVQDLAINYKKTLSYETALARGETAEPPAHFTTANDVERYFVVSLWLDRLDSWGLTEFRFRQWMYRALRLEGAGGSLPPL